MAEAVRRIGDRPIFVRVDGWDVAVSIHDAAHLDERKKWRQRLAAAHPDATGKTASEFLAVKRRFDAWLNAERAWYRHIKLEPPDYQDIRPTSSRKTYLDESVVDAVFRLLCDGRLHKVADLHQETDLVTSKSTIHIAVQRIRERGAIVESVFGYRMIDPTRYRTAQSQRAPTRLAQLFKRHPEWTAVDLAEALGVSRGTLNKTIYALRRRGHKIVTKCNRRAGLAVYEWLGFSRP